MIPRDGRGQRWSQQSSIITVIWVDVLLASSKFEDNLKTNKGTVLKRRA